MRYRRAEIEGATYFFTLTLADRSSQLLVEQIELLRESIRHVKQRHPFEIIAMVILPDHLHAIWRLPEFDSNYALRWSLIKSNFSRLIPKGELVSKSRKIKRERGIWQRRYWEHLIRDEHDLDMHVNYIHYNPVKHGYVRRASDWPYSSLHREIQLGNASANWTLASSDCDVEILE